MKKKTIILQHYIWKLFDSYLCKNNTVFFKKNLHHVQCRVRLISFIKFIFEQLAVSSCKKKSYIYASMILDFT